MTAFADGERGCFSADTYTVHGSRERQYTQYRLDDAPGRLLEMRIDAPSTAA